MRNEIKLSEEAEIWLTNAGNLLAEFDTEILKLINNPPSYLIDLYATHPGMEVSSKINMCLSTVLSDNPTLMGRWERLREKQPREFKLLTDKNMPDAVAMYKSPELRAVMFAEGQLRIHGKQEDTPLLSKIMQDGTLCIPYPKSAEALGLNFDKHQCATAIDSMIERWAKSENFNDALSTLNWVTSTLDEKSSLIYLLLTLNVNEENATKIIALLNQLSANKEQCFALENKIRTFMTAGVKATIRENIPRSTDKIVDALHINFASEFLIECLNNLKNDQEEKQDELTGIYIERFELKLKQSLLHYKQHSHKLPIFEQAIGEWFATLNFTDDPVLQQKLKKAHIKALATTVENARETADLNQIHKKYFDKFNSKYMLLRPELDLHHIKNKRTSTGNPARDLAAINYALNNPNAGTEALVINFYNDCYPYLNINQKNELNTALRLKLSNGSINETTVNQCFLIASASNPQSMSSWQQFKSGYMSMSIGWKILTALTVVMGLAALGFGIVFPPSALLGSGLIAGGAGLTGVSIIGHGVHAYNQAIDYVSTIPEEQLIYPAEAPKQKVALLADDNKCKAPNTLPIPPIEFEKLEAQDEKREELRPELQRQMPPRRNLGDSLTLGIPPSQFAAKHALFAQKVSATGPTASTGPNVETAASTGPNFTIIPTNG